MSVKELSIPKSQPAVIFWLIGFIGLGIAGFGAYEGLLNDEPRQVLSWLLGFGMWFAVAVGMLFMILIWHLFDAGWPVIVRRQLEHAMAAFPWLAIILAPLVLISWFYHENPGIVWDWIDVNKHIAGGHGTVGHDPLYIVKSGFLDLPFFTIRLAVYFLVFCTVSFILRRRSFSLDRNPDPSKVISSRKLAALGMPLVALSATFAAFDLFMSLSYHWFSTMYGVWFFATSMRAGIAATVLLCLVLSRKGHLKGIYNQAHGYNLGCMALAFTVFWAYISFSQYFLIYNANIPEETFWYQMREIDVNGDNVTWWWVSMALIFCYFLIPFVALLFYKTKVIRWRLGFIMTWILVFFVVDMYWNIVPAKEVADNAVGFAVREFAVTFWDIAAIIGVGGICIGAYLSSLRKAATVPVHDPRIQESLHYHE